MGHGKLPDHLQDLVIVQVDIQKNSFIAAYNVDTGKQVWKTARPEIPSWGTPAIYESKDHTELITNSTKAIRGYDPLTGKELWTLTGNSEVTVTTPIIAKDMIFVGNSYPPIRPIYAIKPGASGDISLKDGKTSNNFIAWSNKNGGTYMPTMLAAGDLLYACQNNGVLAAYQLTTGERLYQQRISTEKSSAHTASPVYADGKLYFATEDGDVFVVKSGPKFELLATNPIGEVLMATPAIADGTIFIRSEHHLFAIR